MRAHEHVVVGAVAALLPDVALWAFGWRRRWLPEGHPLVRAHRLLHGPAGLGLAVVLGWVSHVVADHYSTHRAGPAGERVRGLPWWPR